MITYGIIFENVDEITNSGGDLIRKAFRLCQERLNKPLISSLRDDTKKVVGYANNEFVLVAKSYIYGEIVSCHIEALYHAIENNLKLLMYINAVDKFYEFEPNECLKVGLDNRRGGIVMCNFNIRLGRNYETPIPELNGSSD